MINSPSRLFRISPENTGTYTRGLCCGRFEFDCDREEEEEEEEEDDDDEEMLFVDEGKFSVEEEEGDEDEDEE